MILHYPEAAKMTNSINNNRNATTITTSSSPTNHNQARLELLSNTAVLKKVMEDRNASSAKTTLAAAAPTPAKPAVVTAVESPITTTPTMPSSATTTPTTSADLHKPVAEKISLPSPALAGIVSGQTTPASLASNNVPAGTPSSLKTVSSYASLLAPSLSTTMAQAANASPAPALPPFAAFQQFPHSMAMAAVMASAMYGNGVPSNANSRNTSASNNVHGSAFSTPYYLLHKRAGMVPPSFRPPVTVTASPSMDSLGDHHGSAAQTQQQALSYQVLLQENLRLKQESAEKDELVKQLRQKVDGLEQQIVELKQLPTGKISHIPIEDMMRIMEEYGSEVSNQTLPKRKQFIQKASIVRQFRRWNPEFFRYFVHQNGQWVPKLGKEGELKRRAEKRRSCIKNKQQQEGEQKRAFTSPVRPEATKSNDI